MKATKMKRFLTAVLTFVLVVTMSTPVLASKSPDANSDEFIYKNKITDVANLGSDKVSVGYLEEEDIASAKDFLKAYNQGADVYEVLAAADLDYSGAKNSNVQMRLDIPGVNATDKDNILVLHYVNGVWERIQPDDVTDGHVFFSMSGFSPVVISKIPVALSDVQYDHLKAGGVSDVLRDIPGNSHVHNFVGTTCTADGTCASCGATQAAYGHDFTGNRQYCSRCNALNPNYNAGHTHSYTIPATCTEPAKCSCGATNGSALGHDFAGNRQTCSRCGVANPSYDAGHVHDFSIPATCEEGKKCACGATQGAALGHDFGTNNANRYCSRCGKENENYSAGNDNNNTGNNNNNNNNNTGNNTGNDSNNNNNAGNNGNSGNTNVQVGIDTETQGVIKSLLARIDSLMAQLMGQKPSTTNNYYTNTANGGAGGTATVTTTATGTTPASGNAAAAGGTKGGAKTSPKTGQTLPMWPVVAGFAIAGLAFCGKRIYDLSEK